MTWAAVVLTKATGIEMRNIAGTTVARRVTRRAMIRA